MKHSNRHSRELHFWFYFGIFYILCFSGSVYYWNIVYIPECVHKRVTNTNTHSHSTATQTLEGATLVVPLWYLPYSVQSWYIKGTLCTLLCVHEQVTPRQALSQNTNTDTQGNYAGGSSLVSIVFCSGLVY